jgi:hypothetical protein
MYFVGYTQYSSKLKYIVWKVCGILTKNGSKDFYKHNLYYFKVINTYGKHREPTYSSMAVTLWGFSLV